MERPGRKIERTRRAEVHGAGNDYHERRQQRSYPECYRYLSDGCDPPIEENDVYYANAGGDHQSLGPSNPTPDIARVLGEPDVPGRYFERTADDKLPNE